METTQRQKTSLDIVTSTFNEVENISELYLRINRIMTNEPNYSWRLIVCDNFSMDKTWDVINNLANQDSRVLGIRLTRNFKLDNSLSCGLDHCEADAAIFMASDLEDPPETIPTFLRLYEAGNLHIAAQIKEREGISFTRKVFTKLFYFLIKKLSNNLILPNISDFRLVDRKVYLAAKSFPERNRFIRGIFAWTGYEVKYFPLKRPRRKSGKSDFESKKFLFLIDQSLEYIYAFSRVPLKIISLLGVLLGFLGLGFLVFFVFLTLNNGVPFAGFGSIVSIFILCFAVTFINLGVLGSYLGLIYEEVKLRPNYIILESTKRNNEI
jgi:glycosyltransferase involved in cell wall biosynthesis